MNESPKAWENMTPEEKKKELFLSKRKRWTFSLNATPFQRRNMIKASEISLKKWALRNINGKSPTSVGLFLFLEIC